MFFQNHNQNAPMTRRQMNRLLGKCQEELFGAGRVKTNSHYRPLLVGPQMIMSTVLEMATRLGGWS